MVAMKHCGAAATAAAAAAAAANTQSNVSYVNRVSKLRNTARGVRYCGCLCIENGCGRNERDGKRAEKREEKMKRGTTKWMENVRPANHTIKYVRCR